MRGFTFVPNRPFREWGDVPIRPNKHSVCAQSNQMLIGFIHNRLSKRLPRQECVGARALTTSFRGRRKDVSASNVSPCCVEFCDRHHLLRNKSRARVPLRTLLVFGCLAFAPSKECCLCLLTKFGLTQPMASFRCWVDKRCLAFNIFNALPPHTVAVAYSGPITTGHN